MLDAAKILANSVSFNTRFQRVLEETENDRRTLYTKIASVFPSDNPVETYSWLGQVPQMKRWIGDRELHKLRAEKYAITNYDWANGIEVTKDDLRDDKLGLVASRIGDLAKQGVKAVDRQVANILNNAFTSTGGLGYDGQYLIDTDHQVLGGGGGTAQSNSAGTTALDEDAFEAGLAAMGGIKDENGETAGISPTHLVVGYGAWRAARRIIGADYNADGLDNLNKGLVQLVLSPWITGGKWFLVDMSQGVGPVIVQMRQAATFRDPNMGGNALDVFMRKDYKYGADMTFGTGIGLWQTIYGSNAA